MRTSKFTVEQISHALRRAEGGVAVAEICGELQITETTFYRWKRKYHGLGTLAARASSTEGRELQAQAGRRGSDPGSHDAARRHAKKLLRPAVKRMLVAWWQETYRVSQRRACGT